MSDGMLDIIIMEPFDILDAPQVAIEMFNKTLNKSSKIKTFKAKHIHIHRKKEGVIHFDGDPIMTGTMLILGLYHEELKLLLIRKNTRINESLI